MSNALTVIDDVLSKVSDGFVKTIASYKWELIPTSQLQAAKQMLTKNDYIMKIAANDPGAVHDALMNAAILGLDLTPGKNQGWLLPRKSQKKDATGNFMTIIILQTGYKGVEAIHQRLGVIDRLSIRVVRENDEFSWSGDDQEKPFHDGGNLASDETRGPIKGAFVVTYFLDKTIQVVTASISEIFEKHRDIADSWKAYQKKLTEGKYAREPPWVTHEKAMVEKTMVYIGSKQWPANIRDEGQSSKILETLHHVDTADYSAFKKPYSEKQYEIHQEYVHGDDALGYYLLSRYLCDDDLEIYMALEMDHIKTIPRGKKGTPGKGTERDRLSQMYNDGESTYFTLINGEPDVMLECIEGCSKVTISLLKKKMNEEQLAAFAETTKEEKNNV